MKVYPKVISGRAAERREPRPIRPRQSPLPANRDMSRPPQTVTTN